MHSSGHSFKCKAVFCNAVCTRTLTGIPKSAQGKMRKADFCSFPEKHLLWFLLPKWPAAKSMLCEIIYQVTQQRLFSAGSFFLFYLDSNGFTKDELLAPSHTLFVWRTHWILSPCRWRDIPTTQTSAQHLHEPRQMLNCSSYNPEWQTLQIQWMGTSWFRDGRKSLWVMESNEYRCSIFLLSSLSFYLNNPLMVAYVHQLIGTWHPCQSHITYSTPL